MSRTINRQAVIKRLRRKKGWTLWLMSRPLDVVSSATYLSVWILCLYNRLYSPSYFLHPIQTWEAVLISVATLALLAIDRIEYWLYGEAVPLRIAISLFITRIILVEIVAQIDLLDFSPLMYLIIPFYAALYFGNLAGYIAAGIAWLVRFVKFPTGWYNDQIEVKYFIMYSIALFFVVTMVRVVNKEKQTRTRAEQLLAELETSHRQLKAYSEQVAELATSKERNRLARDIHDSLGHYLTVINVQLEKALTFRDKKPQIADQAVVDAKRSASEALQDVRRSVGALRATQELFSFREATARLVEDVRKSSLMVELKVSGSEVGYSNQTLLTLYRAAQEGLTNVQRHAQAARVTLEVDFLASEAHFHLSDDGQGFEPTILKDLPLGRESGYGLQGIEERLELVGGSLKITSEAGGGTHLVISVPKKAPVLGFFAESQGLWKQ